MAVTAKVLCQTKTLSTGDYTTLVFIPDYQDPANKEWATSTPNLSLNMTVKKAIGDMFSPGQKFTLTFDKE